MITNTGRRWRYAGSARRESAIRRLILVASLLAAPPALAITRDEVLDRAQAWVDDAVPYSWNAWYTDPTSGTCCYRSDCSGLVSAAWGLPAPGQTTYSLAEGPWDSGVSYRIQPGELLPGDALNYPGDPGAGTGHVMLYVDGDFASGWVKVYEEYSHGHNATLRWRAINTAIYLPIRFVDIEDHTCAVEVCDGLDNDCDGAVDEGWLCEQAEETTLAAWRADPAASTDLDGDGRADVCMRGSAGLQCSLSQSDAFVAVTRLTDLSNAAGYGEVSAAASLRFADIDADGRADVCARHPTAGFGCWRSTGVGFGARIAGPALTDALGWGDPANADTVRMMDVNADGRADVCARADSGVLCWLSDGAGFPTRINGPAWTDALGWHHPQYVETLRAGDVDGDGRDDLCARGSQGVDCWRSDGAGFPSRVTGPALSNALGWDDPRYYRSISMPDLNGDGRADLCARGAAAMYCWISAGTSFGGTITGPALSDALGWDDFSYASTLRWADVTGDGLDDVCARSRDGIRCWPSTGAGFGPMFAGPALSNALGWSDYDNFATLELADLDSDGRADLCARADSGLRCWRSNGAGFPSQVVGPEWSDALGWDDLSYAGTFRFAGGAYTPGLDVAEPDTGGAALDTDPPVDTSQNTPWELVDSDLVDSDLVDTDLPAESGAVETPVDSTVDSDDTAIASADSGETAVLPADTVETTDSPVDSAADTVDSPADSVDSAADTIETTDSPGDSAADTVDSPADSVDSAADTVETTDSPVDSTDSPGDSAADTVDSLADSVDSDTIAPADSVDSDTIAPADSAAADSGATAESLDSDTVDTTESPADTETVEVDTPADTVDTRTDPVDSPPETAEPVDTVETAETADTAETVETAEPIDTVETAETAEPPDTVETAETVETNESVETAETAETADPAETADVTDTPEDSDEPAMDKGGGGCACDASSTRSGLPLGLLLVLAVRRRRA